MHERLLPRTEPVPDIQARFDEIDRIQEPSQIVAQLVDLLGPKTVALIGGASDTKQVRRWLNGTQPERADALRAALRAARIIADIDSANVAKAWFLGAQRDLEYHSPVLELQSNTPQSYVNVVRAAVRFAGA